MISYNVVIVDNKDGTFDIVADANAENINKLKDLINNNKVRHVSKSLSCAIETHNYPSYDEIVIIKNDNNKWVVTSKDNKWIFSKYTQTWRRTDNLFTLSTKAEWEWFSYATAFNEMIRYVTNPPKCGHHSNVLLEPINSRENFDVPKSGPLCPQCFPEIFNVASS